MRVHDVMEQPRVERTDRRAATRWFMYGLVAALLVAMAVQISSSQADLAVVRRLSLQVLAITCALQFASQIFLNGSLLLPLQGCVTHLGFWELYLVRTGGSFVGSLVPVAGGLAVRLAYLKNRGLTYLDFTWATLLSNVLALGSAALLAAAATGVLWIVAGRPSGLVVGASAGILLLSAAAVAGLSLVPRLSRVSRLQSWRWLTALGDVAMDRGLTLRVFGFSLARHALNFITFGLLYRTLAPGPADFLAGGLVYALTSPIRMVNITPANLGVAEWFVAIAGRQLAFDVVTGLLVALAFRVIGMIAQGLGALFASAWLAFGSRRTA